MKKILSLIIAIAATVAMHAEVIWTGEHSVGSWSALRLTPSVYPALAGIGEGDVICLVKWMCVQCLPVVMKD